MSEGKRWISWPDKWIILVHNSNHFHQVLRRDSNTAKSTRPVEPCDFLYLPTLFINGAVANFVSPLHSFPIGKPVKINQKTLKGSSKRPWKKFCLTTKIISSILREKFRSNIGRETAKIQHFFSVSIWRCSFSTTKLCK